VLCFWLDALYQVYKHCVASVRRESKRYVALSFQ
jgi:hypothetical protein